MGRRVKSSYVIFSMSTTDNNTHLKGISLGAYAGVPCHCEITTENIYEYIKVIKYNEPGYD